MRKTFILVPFALAFVASAACTMDSTSSSSDDWKKQGKKHKDAGDPQPSVLECGGGIQLPNDQYFIADGLCVRAVATDLGLMRQIAFSQIGDLYGVTRDGVISRFRDRNSDGFYDASEREVFATMDGVGNNVEIAGSFLYAGASSSVKRFSLDRDQMPCQTFDFVVTGIPAGGQHALHTVRVIGNWLYVHAGSSANAIAPMSPDYDTDRSVIKRFDLAKLGSMGRPYDWKEGEVFAKGLRNTVGIRADAQGHIYAVDNGMDDLSYRGQDIHLQNPADKIVQVAQDGAYGYPYCFDALRVQDENKNFITPGTMLKTTAKNLDGSLFESPHDNAWCAANARRADALLPAHIAPLDILFNDTQLSSMLPSQYQNGAFVTAHGSWDVPSPRGFEVLFLKRDANGQFQQAGVDCDGNVKLDYQVIFGGGTSERPSEAPWGWTNQDVGETIVRPVGLAIQPQTGALFVSSDDANVIDHPEIPALGKGALYRIMATKSSDKR